MKKLNASDLKEKFIKELVKEGNFTYDYGNPFLITQGINQFHVFIKNLSPAYFKNLPDITRVQLPFSTHFSKILNGNIPFLILGYDADSDIVVSWNPSRIKDRLNAKSNVSLYSRTSLQRSVSPGEFKLGILSNGERIILFKLVHLPVFFNNVFKFFDPGIETASISIDDLAVRPTLKERYISWLNEKYAEKTVKGYTYGLNKVCKDLKQVNALKENSLFDVENVSILQQLYNKWYSIREFRENDMYNGKYMYSNAFKRLIDFISLESSNKNIAVQQNNLASEPLTNDEMEGGIDDSLLKIIIPLLNENKVLQAVAITSEFYATTRPNFKFNHWYKIVSSIYKRMKH